MTDNDVAHDTPVRRALGMLWLIFAPLVAIGAIAFAAGVIAGAAETGRFGTGFFVALALAALVMAFAVWLTLRLLPRYTLPRSPRMRQGRMLLYASALTGVAIGAAAMILQGDDPRSMMRIVSGEDPLPPALTWLLVIGTAASFVLSVRWHRLLDEHERAAYDFGAVAALYVYFGLSTIWWLLWRGEFASAPDGVLIFILTTATWMIGWLYRRFV